MTTEFNIFIPTVTDEKIINVFRSISISLPGSTCSINTGLVQGSPLDPNDKIVKFICEINSTVLQSASVNLVNEIVIQYYRGGLSKKSEFFDEFRITEYGSYRIENEKKLKIQAQISALRGSVDRPEAYVPSAEQQELMKAHHVTLNRLESLNADLIKNSEEFRRKLEENFDVRKEDLQKEFFARNEELNGEIDKKNEEIKIRVIY